MANTTNQKTRSRKASPAPVGNAELDILVSTTDPVEAKDSAAKADIKAKEIDLSQYITVRNGFQGKLVYKSSRTGETFVWDNFGAEQEMELRELKNAKNSNKNFFINNWFMFDEDWVIDYLGLGQFYKNAISIDCFDDIFKMSSSELETRIAELSNGQRQSVAYRAKELIADNKIDSLSIISALESSLGVELIEK